MTQALVELQNVSFIHNFEFVLNDFSWCWKKGLSFALMGKSGSGKSLLAEIFCDLTKVSKGTVVRNEKIAYVSLKQQKLILLNEERNDMSEIMDGKADPGTLAKDIILEGKQPTEEYLNYLKLFQCEHIQERGFKYLSTGETRKTLLIKALISGSKSLVLDEPYEGLDVNSRECLKNILDSKVQSGYQLCIIVNRKEDVPKSIKKLVVLDSGKIEYQGDLNEWVVEEVLESKGQQACSFFETKDEKAEIQKEILIEMNDVNVNYESTCVLKNLNWKVVAGQHFQVSGPNGSGKSTLLSLISGDNPKAFGQAIKLFGIQKGSGESVWELKKKMGIVSSSFHLTYREAISVYNVVLSGFFDSVGLYKHAGGKQLEDAKKLIEDCGMKEVLHTNFQDLSYGLQRMVLILRALVKKPKLLLLDEPCQGLDGQLNGRVLTLIDFIATMHETTIIYVSHLKEDGLKSIKNFLELDMNGAYKLTHV